MSRNIDYCPYCGTTIGQIDKTLDIKNGSHRATKDFIELVTYMGQMAVSFGDAQELLQKLLDIEISIPQIQKITEEIGKRVYEQDLQTAKMIFKQPEKYATEALETDKANTTLYILMDGSAVNTRVQDENGNSWREMKLGMIFSDKDIIWRKNKAENAIILKKEYVSYFGSVKDFKELLFAAAVRAGYGKVKKTVVIADGAHWIWNLCSVYTAGKLDTARRQRLTSASLKIYTQVARILHSNVLSIRKVGRQNCRPSWCNQFHGLSNERPLRFRIESFPAIMIV